jgi:hypothetical protein
MGHGELRVRWNGKKSETTKDRFSDRYDFEGYRVYLSLSPNPDQFNRIVSYDREDYNRYTWDGVEWTLRDIPFTIDSLRKLYGENFQPLDYTMDNFFTYIDSDNNTNLYYFVRQDYNLSDLTNPDGIHKVYPDEPPPSTINLDSARLYYPDELTDDGLFLKYYEYEYILKNLLPSQLYYVGVTAFDYGSPGELESLEYGFEGRNYVDGPNKGRIVMQDGISEDRTRSIHFLNLPHRCTIRIFTIDGDLIREIEHDYPKDSPRSMHERWDIITRNTQAAVSGIYYYSVESEFGNQIGKIVIIM